MISPSGQPDLDLDPRLAVRPVPPLRGSLIGDRYRILRTLGQGGMGAVYLAVQEDSHHQAAVKILFPEYSRERRWVERLFREAHAVNLTSHPGLVKIFSCGQADDLIPGEEVAYIIMEYLEGDSLWRRLARLHEHGGRLPIASALRLARQIASALACVHDKGVIHRDLKPENVLLVPDPEVPGGERAKLVDFGIAKFDDAGEGGRRTTGGKVMGTPIYMSPEQCRGAPLSGKSDVYALGVMLHEMLAGKPPFEHDEPGMLMTMHIRDQPPPLAALRPDIPPAVAELVGEMLAKEPLDRPAMVSVEDIIERLEENTAALPSPSAHSERQEETAAAQTPQAPIVVVAGHPIIAASVVPVPPAATAVMIPPQGRASRGAVALVLAFGVLGGVSGLFFSHARTRQVVEPHVDVPLAAPPVVPIAMPLLPAAQAAPPGVVVAPARSTSPPERGAQIMPPEPSPQAPAVRRRHRNHAIAERGPRLTDWPAEPPAAPVSRTEEQPPQPRAVQTPPAQAVQTPPAQAVKPARQAPNRRIQVPAIQDLSRAVVPAS